MNVYVSTKTAPTAENPIKISDNGNEANKNNFISDVKEYGVVYNTSGFLELSVLNKVEFDSNGGSEIDTIYVENGKNIY